ncbi:hypothetical protein WDW89_09770 [Deltaproteobacteria bacterium TL4]
MMQQFYDSGSKFQSRTLILFLIVIYSRFRYGLIVTSYADCLLKRFSQNTSPNLLI